MIVPTRNERDNIGPLIARLTAALVSIDAEVLFVDDSDDDTPAVVTSEAAVAHIPVRLLHRTAEHRHGGLGGAVKMGLLATDSDWIVVMDGDLQHPPEIVPLLLDAGHSLDQDLVIASRYGGTGGDAGGLSSGPRRFVSSATTVLTRVVFPELRARVTDPMSGFFAARRSSVDPSRLDPDGFKILLEILVRTSPARVGEIPFSFAERHGGDSKASPAEGLRFLRQVIRLRFARAVRPAVPRAPLVLTPAPRPRSVA